MWIEWKIRHEIFIPSWTTDGVFPLITKDSGILSDNDSRESLETKESKLILIVRLEFWRTVSVYKALTLTFKNLTYNISNIRPWR